MSAHDRRTFLGRAGSGVLMGSAAMAAIESSAAQAETPQEQRQPTPPSLAYALGDLLAERRASGQAYHGFFRVPSMNMGIYHLAPPGRPMASPPTPTTRPTTSWTARPC